MKRYEFSTIQKIGYRPYIKMMVDELNEVKITPRNYHTFLYDEDDPDASFLGGIAVNERAIEYLKDIGLLNNGICPLCGNRPIENKFTFTSGLNTNISFHICKNCYKQGNQTSMNPKNKEGCFIATCCYGDYDCKEVLRFRKFRDTTLEKTFLGKLFVRFYYIYSPVLVRYIGTNTHFKNFIKKHVLDKFYIFLIKRDLNGKSI